MKRKFPDAVVEASPKKQLRRKSIFSSLKEEQSAFKYENSRYKGYFISKKRKEELENSFAAQIKLDKMIQIEGSATKNRLRISRCEKGNDCEMSQSVFEKLAN